MKRDTNISNGMKRKKEKLLKKGFIQKSENIFVKKNKVVILKSVVYTTNKNEINSISVKETIYETIKNKNIKIEVFERNCFRSVDYKNYSFMVFKLLPTNTFRDRKTKTMRYKIISFDNVGFKTLQSNNNSFNIVYKLVS